MAGRNISVTHMALSSARVMGTCATMGQAVGTAAAMAVIKKKLPREIGQEYIDELQQQLMFDDCYLPGHILRMTSLDKQFSLKASHGNPAVLRNGVDRPVGETENFFELPTSGWIILEASEPTWVDTVDIVFDSDLSTQIITMDYSESYSAGHKVLPDSLVTSFSVSFRIDSEWITFAEVNGNKNRLCRMELKQNVSGIKIDNFRTGTNGRTDMVRLFRISIR